MVRLLTVTSLLLSLVACNLGPKDTVDDSADDSGPSTHDGPTIADVRTGVIAVDETVNLEGVIVTSPLTADAAGFFIQDSGGGPNSGIYVFMQGGTDGLFISPGDKVNVTGRATDYYGWMELTVSDVSAVSVIGSGDVTVDPVDPCTTTDWEPWESGLISLGNTSIVTGPNRYGEAELGCGGLMMDNLFYDFSTEAGASYTDVIGTLGYSFETWKIFPRSDDDLLGYVPGEGPGSYTIPELQQGAVSDGDEVVLEGVVVTSGLTARGDGFFIQQPGGGEYSGIYVFLYDGDGSLDIAPGDTINLTANFTEYYDWTELGAEQAGVEVVSSGATVTVDAIDPAALSDLEPWESCLVSVGASEVTSDIDNYGEVTLASGIKMDNFFFEYSTESGATYTDIIGPMGYSFSDWKIFPRSEADLLGYVPGEGGGGGDVHTVVEVQGGDVAEGSAVRLEGVIVTSGPSNNGKSFHVADAAGGQWSGVLVYNSGGFTSVPAVGSLVNIEGRTTEYYELTEVEDAVVTVVGTGTVPAPVELSAAPSDWEPYEGVEVKLLSVAITSDPDQYNEVTTSFGINIDDFFYAFTASSGDSFSSVTGHITYSFGAYKLVPDAAGDLVP